MIDKLPEVDQTQLETAQSIYLTALLGHQMFSTVQSAQIASMAQKKAVIGQAEMNFHFDFVEDEAAEESPLVNLDSHKLKTD